MNIPHPKSWFNSPPADRDESADRPRPGEVDLKRLLVHEPILDVQLERRKTPDGKLPFLIGELRDPRGRLTCMRLLSIWQGFLIIREVASVDEARAIHAELEKLLLGAVK